MLPGLVDPFPNCYFLVCVFILPLMVIVFKLYLLKRNVVTFYPLTVVLIFYLCSLLGRDIALIMVQICRKESILLLLSNLNIQELLIHFIIVLSLLFNRSIKPNMRFLTKTSKLSILLTTYIVLALLRDSNFNIQ